MAKKIKVFLLILSLAFTLSYMSNTYSRYDFVKHIKTCSNCGVSIEENHQNAHGTLVCLICGFGIGGNLSQRAR